MVISVIACKIRTEPFWRCLGPSASFSRSFCRPSGPDGKGQARTARGELTVATPQNAYKMWKSSHGDVMLPVGVHLPNVKTGCQKLRGQKRIEMKYCIQLWSDVRLAAVDGICGGAVL